MSKAMARPRHVDIPGETILLELPESLAGAIRDALGGRPFRVVRHWLGNTADAYLLALEPGTPRLVLKVARTGHSLRDDTEALRRAATLAPAGVVPAIVGAFASDAACLVEYIPGLSPAVYLRRRTARAGRQGLDFFQGPIGHRRIERQQICQRLLSFLRVNPH